MRCCQRCWVTSNRRTPSFSIGHGRRRLAVARLRCGSSCAAGCRSASSGLAALARTGVRLGEAPPQQQRIPAEIGTDNEHQGVLAKRQLLLHEVAEQGTRAGTIYRDAARSLPSFRRGSSVRSVRSPRSAAGGAAGVATGIITAAGRTSVVLRSRVQQRHYNRARSTATAVAKKPSPHSLPPIRPAELQTYRL